VMVCWAMATAAAAASVADFQTSSRS